MKNFLLNFRSKLSGKLPIVVSFLVGVLLGAAAGWLIGSDWINDGESSPGYEIRQSGYRYTNPLLECEVAGNITESKELRPFKYKVQELVDEKLKSGKASNLSVYFRDLNNGPWFGINEKEDFSPASLLKVPIMIALLKQAESDPRVLAWKVRAELPEDLNEMENIKPSITVDRGKIYTMEELLYRMIVYSDNNAREILIKNMDGRLFTRAFIDLGIEVPGFRKLEDFMSVKTYASFFRILFNASYLSREMSEKALEYLSQTEFKDALVAGVPPGIVVAHKFGERRIMSDEDDVKQLHDCGIIYYPGRPYLLCVMSRGHDFPLLDDNIREISTLVFNEIDRQTRGAQ